MAKMTEEPGVDMEERVAFTFPRRDPRERQIQVSVNGETITIKPGKPVKIKRKFVEVLQHAIEQEEAAERTKDAIEAEGRKPMAEW